MHICTTYLFSTIYCHLNRIKKKQDPYFSVGKKLKRYATLPRYLSFLLGKGGKLLHLNVSKRTLKHPKVHFLTISPYNALV